MSVFWYNLLSATPYFKRTPYKYHNYFHPELIIKILCKQRVKFAAKRHKLHLLVDISHAEHVINDLQRNSIPEELKSVLPPRRKWYRPNEEERREFPNSQKLLEYSLVKTIRSEHIRAKEPSYSPPQWYKNLNRLINNIQRRANNPNVQKIQKPTIKGLKKENSKQCKEYRPISLYNFEDRIIIGQTAKYFTDVFDDYFHPCSLAFRAVKSQDGKRSALSHHDAISKISEFQKLQIGKEIWVGECDIQKFFDCVNHRLIKDLLFNFLVRNKIKISGNATKHFLQYLNSYSFSKDVFPLNNCQSYQTEVLQGGYFKWVAEDLKNIFYKNFFFKRNLSNVRIGVPQGGALSCFISNLVLHSADCKLMSGAQSNSLYVRFCDDMVLLSISREECLEKLDLFKKELSACKLLVHEAAEITSYNKHFWKAKSKLPYLWGPRASGNGNVPWLSFVGYQIKFDGSIRIRKKSFVKEIKKQQEECRKILKAINFFKAYDQLNTSSRKSRRQQLYALENRLISMSVGRVKLHQLSQKPSLCWTVGFKALNVNQTAVSQLKRLDKSRSRNLYKVKKLLKKLNKQSHKPDEDQKIKKYFGSPFSYHSHIHRLK